MAQDKLNLEEVFEKHDGEYSHFERIENPRHPRPDICAFLMLHDLVPGDRDMVCSAEHDQIWLDTDLEELAERATEAQIIDLIRCGVMYDDETGGLSMYA
jgi:hypothetical protein